MHISYIIIVLKKLLSKLAISKKFKYIIIICSLVNFLIFINYPVSAIRSVIVQSVNLIAFCINRKSSFLNNMCISLFIILAINPYNIQSVGMWLSFGGVLGIFLFYKFIFKSIFPKKIIHNAFKGKIIKKIINFSLEQICLNFAVQIIIFPILWYNFYSISLISFLSNLITAPLIAPIIILGYLSFLEEFIFINIFSKINTILIEILFFLVEVLSKLPFSMIYIKKPNFIFLVVYYVLIFFIIYKVNKNTVINFLHFFRLKSGKKSMKLRIKELKKAKVIIIFTIFILLFQTTTNIVNKKLEIYFLDVGQGDCTVIKTIDNKFIVIDAGEGKESGYDYGKNVLFPFLINKGAKKIDFLFISHFDSDHIGGIFSIIEEISIGEVFISKQKENSKNLEEFLKIARKKAIKINLVNQGDRINFEENLYMDILWPKDELQILENPINNNSIVSKLVYKNFSILFTGDIEEIAEKEILNTYKNNLDILNATILKVAHHGSKTSSSLEFLKEVKPKYALIGVGKNNKFGHPSSSVIQNLTENKVRIYRTDETGEITITVDKKGNIAAIKKYL